MTELLLPSPTRGDTFPRSLRGICRQSSSRCSRSEDIPDLKHSKSDDLVVNSPTLTRSESKCTKCDTDVACSSKDVYSSGDDLNNHVIPRAKYFSDSESDIDLKSLHVERINRKLTADRFLDAQRNAEHRTGLYDRVDPEDSIRDIMSENDFYRFVLFKRHYDKYLHLSKKYEEARNIAYYLEEKYHEIKAERDELLHVRQVLEHKLETKELELHEKEEELFLQLERVVRLEEDCEKLRAEKEKFEQMKIQLEKEKIEAYRQLKRQAVESENTRRGLEKARQEIVQQVTVIAAEKESLEKENEQLKEVLGEERKGHYVLSLEQQKKHGRENVLGLEKEVTDLKFIARQSASLNNHFKKGMKHLATCRRKKCSVCAYTKSTFGEYQDRDDGKLLGCFQAPLQDLRKWIRPVPLSASCSEDEGTSLHKERERISSMSGFSMFLGHSSPFPSSRSEYSFNHAYSSDAQTSTTSPSPTPSLPLEYMSCSAVDSLKYISYIDEAASETSGDSGHGEDADNVLDAPSFQCPFNVSGPTDASLTSSSTPPVAARAFSSDSGFSSELYDTTGRKSSKNKSSCEDGDDGKPAVFQRSKWTSSFRKLISKVSKK